MKMTLYHASKNQGLRILLPRESTHGAPYVYATQSLAMALLFGAKKDDFDFLMDEENGRPRLYECYPDAFEQVYAHEFCSVYEVDGNLFARHDAVWHAEYIAESPVPVLKETKVFDLHGQLMEEISRGHLILHRYRTNPEYKRKIANHIVDRLIRFEVLDGEIPQKLLDKFPQIIQQLEDILTGRTL
jgi:hypothetical protein